MKYIVIVFCTTIMLSSCVSMKKFQDQENLAAKYKRDKEKCGDELSKAQNDISLLNTKVSDCESSKAALNNSLLEKQQEANNLKKLNDELDAYNKSLQNQLNDVITASGQKQNEFSEALALKEKMLSDKEKNLQERENEIAALRANLQSQISKAEKLEQQMLAKDSALIALKNRITEVLKGFNSDELTIETKNGKIYVSMSEKLLFSSGKYNIDEKGKSVLAKLATALKKQQDVEVVVEGHTDNVPFAKPVGDIRNNWDLSVLRASSVVKILVEENELPPEMVLAGGKGKYGPVASNETDEGKSKNRRTEIILSPKLDKILEILNN